MKKLVGGVLVALVLGLLVLSVVSGRSFTSQLDKMAEQAAKDPRVEILASDIQSGWLSSSGEMTLVFTLDARVDLLITSEWQASHRPGWVTFKGLTGLQSQDKESGESLDLLAELGLDPLPFQGRADWNQASYRMDLDALAVADENFSIDFSGGQLEASYHYASSRQTGQLLAETLTLGGGQFTPSTLDFKDLLLQWEQEGSYPWISGNLNLALEEIYFTGPQGEVRFDRPQASQHLQLSEESFDLKLDMSTGEVSSAGRSLGSAAIGLSTQDFKGQPMAKLMEFFSEEADWENLDEEAMQPGIAAINELLEGSPAILLDHLQVKLITPFEINQKAEGSARFDGRNLPSSYLNRLTSGEISEEDFASRVRVELLFDKINPDLLLLVGIPPFLQDESADQQSLVWEAGEVRLNGKRLPF
ncbi:protein of unknown function [Marinospirillum celere]|uniref:DUF945 domain-containing protein n=1 Tax=Marinospirillum celere TaxID=1122252 RepID=A0A1I1H5L6_9GAMM|nr:DUF945 family protein [Marinospirillum celere]SFC19479.1 protein of unknown function [Marinospirillum celere]